MQTFIRRRDFLKQTGAAAALAAVAPPFTATDLTAASAKKRPIKKAMMYSTIGFQGSVLDKFKALKEAGFAGVEPMSHMSQDEVKKALEETGLQAASVCCAT